MSDVLKAEKMSTSTVNFFSMLADNSRLNKSKEIFVAWKKIMAAHRGEIVCNVTTAKVSRIVRFAVVLGCYKLSKS